MALHFFHFSDGHTTLDLVGTNHPELISVRKEAVRIFSELLNTALTHTLWTGEPWKVWVTDQPNGTGRTVLTLEMNAR